MSVPTFSKSPLVSAENVRRRVFYGWWIVGVSVFLLTLMALTVFQGLGTFLVALERQFGWSRTAVSGAFSLARVQGAVIGPIEGFLVDRMGSRRMVLIGYVIMGIGFLLLSGVPSLSRFTPIPNVWPTSGLQEIWHFYLAFIVITLGSSLGGWLALLAVVNNWFARRRSFAMAAAQSGVHFGGFLVPVLALSIDSHGFRWTTFGIGVFLLAIIFPATRVIRNHPEDYGLRPDGDPAPSRAVRAAGPRTRAEPEDELEFTVAQALSTPVFWILTLVHLSSSVSIVTLALHLVPKLTDMGMSLSGAGVVVLTYTAIALPSQFAAGYVADRLPKPPVIFFFLMFQAISMAVIAIAEDIYMAYLFAVLFGVGFGGRVPLLTAIRGDYFGRKAFATIMGLSQFPNNLAMIGAPLFAAYMFDTTGTYLIPFSAFAALNFLGAVLVLLARKPKNTLTGQPDGRREETTSKS